MSRKDRHEPKIGDMGIDMDIIPIRKEWYTIYVPEGLALCLIPIFHYYFTKFDFVRGYTYDEMREYARDSETDFGEMPNSDISRELSEFYNDGYDDSDFKDCFFFGKYGRLSRIYAFRVRYKPEDIRKFCRQFYGNGRNEMYHEYLVRKKERQIAAKESADSTQK